MPNSHVCDSPCAPTWRDSDSPLGRVPRVAPFLWWVFAKATGPPIKNDQHRVCHPIFTRCAAKKKKQTFNIYIYICYMYIYMLYIYVIYIYVIYIWYIYVIYMIYIYIYVFYIYICDIYIYMLYIYDIYNNICYIYICYIYMFYIWYIYVYICLYIYICVCDMILEKGKRHQNPLEKLMGESMEPQATHRGQATEIQHGGRPLQRATCNVSKRVWFHRFNDFHAGNPTEIWSSNSFYPGKLHDLTSSAQNQHIWYQFTTILTYYGIIPVYQLI